MSFVKQVAAYLTGWVIAQSLFLRVWKYIIGEDTEKLRTEWQHELATSVAMHISDELRADMDLLNQGLSHDPELVAEHLWAHLTSHVVSELRQGAVQVDLDGLKSACRDLAARRA